MSETIPNHIGLILDGNRRWAKSKNLPSLEGHRKGSQVFEEIALYAFKRGVKSVTGFVFSSENWKRTDDEVGYLMNMAVKAVDNYLDTFHKEGIKIVILGRKNGIRSKVLKSLKKAEKVTENNKNGTLGICFNYSGIDEIVDTTRNLISKKIKSDEVTKELIESNLYAPELPNIDLIIRTSGEKRLSGFMLWRVAYAELYFSNINWPDFTKKDFDNAIDYYSSRNRRYGC